MLKQCYCYYSSLAFEKVLADPQLAIYFGNPITSIESGSTRSGRRLIVHSMYDDDKGNKHVQVHGRLEGPRCEGVMHADMIWNQERSDWEMDWMYVDVGPPYRKRVVLKHQKV